jgi:hypothetical protein
VAAYVVHLYLKFQIMYAWCSALAISLEELSFNVCRQYISLIRYRANDVVDRAHVLRRVHPKIKSTLASAMTSSAGLFPSQEPSKEILLDWLKQNEIHVCDGTEIYESGNGWGVRATRDIGFDALRTFPFFIPTWRLE